MNQPRQQRAQSSLRPAFRTAARASDSAAVREIIASTGCFSGAEIDIAVELIEDRIARDEKSDYRFLFADRHGEPIGYSCYGHIAGTQASYDLYWIAVHDDYRGNGIGRKLLAESERRIGIEGGQRVYIETSSREQYEPTRQFYLRCGYRIDAVLEDFYAPGDGKLIMVKVI